MSRPQQNFKDSHPQAIVPRPFGAMRSPPFHECFIHALNVQLPLSIILSFNHVKHILPSTIIMIDRQTHDDLHTSKCITRLNLLHLHKCSFLNLAWASFWLAQEVC